MPTALQCPQVGEPIMSSDIDLARSLAAQLHGKAPAALTAQTRMLLLRMARKLELLARFEQATEGRAFAARTVVGAHTFEMEVILSGDEVFSHLYDARLRTAGAVPVG